MRRKSSPSAKDAPAHAEICFTRMLDRHRTPITQFLYRFVADQDVAEELAQDVFLRAHSSLAIYGPPGQLAAWLYRAAAQSARGRLFGGLPAPARPQLESPESRIRSAMAALPAFEQAAVLMHKYERFDYAQIAHVLECSDTAAKHLLLRAYQILRRQWSSAVPQAAQPVSGQVLAPPLPTGV